MLFGISYGELAAIILVGAVAFGPKDLPVIARAAGRLTGQAVGYVSALRSRAQTFAEKTQLDELHKELQQTMSQLEAIRYEIRSGANILVPGTMTNRLATRAVEATSARMTSGAEGGMQTTVTSDPVESMEAPPSASSSSAAAASATSPSGPHFHQRNPATLVPLTGANLDNTASARGRPSVERVGIGSLGLQHAEKMLERRTESGASAGGAGGAASGIETLPISAVSAGLLPRRADGASGGADILSDAIVERQISMQANEFLRNMSKPPHEPR